MKIVLEEACHEGMPDGKLCSDLHEALCRGLVQRDPFDMPFARQALAMFRIMFRTQPSHDLRGLVSGAVATFESIDGGSAERDAKDGFMGDSQEQDESGAGQVAYRYFYEMMQKIKTLQDDGVLPPMIAMFDSADHGSMPLYLQDAQRTAQMRRGFERLSSSPCARCHEICDEPTVRAFQPLARFPQGLPSRA